MTASTPKATVAAIESVEDAVIDMAALAMKTARRIGTPTRDPIAAIYDQRVKRQARRFLLAAAMHLHGGKAFAACNILGVLSCIDLARADDHEGMAECWEGIEDIARDMARECREYAGGDAA